MKAKLFDVVLLVMITLSILFVFRVGRPDALVARPPASHAQLAVPAAAGSPQYPVMDAVANKIIQKYQTSTCEQLWQEKAQGKNKSKSPQEQEVLGVLHNDAQLRAAFINKIAAPIANKMFDCGMIP